MSLSQEIANKVTPTISKRVKSLRKSGNSKDAIARIMAKVDYISIYLDKRGVCSSRVDLGYLNQVPLKLIELHG